MYCVHCGVRNNKADTHCTSCGKQLPELKDQTPPPLPPRPKPMSKGFYIILSLIPVLVTVILVVALIRSRHRHYNVTLSSVLIIIIAAAVCQLVIQTVLVYKCWAAIQDGTTKLPAGEAAGYLLIPIFNIYWQFRAIYGYAKEYNAFLIRHNLDAPQLPEDCYLAYCISSCGSLLRLKVLSMISAVLTLIAWFFIIIPQSIDAVNYLANRPEPESAPE